jgi:hypothetical protein
MNCIDIFYFPEVKIPASMMIGCASNPLAGNSLQSQHWNNGRGTFCNNLYIKTHDPMGVVSKI